MPIKTVDRKVEVEEHQACVKNRHVRFGFNRWFITVLLNPTITQHTKKRTCWNILLVSNVNCSRFHQEFCCTFCHQGFHWASFSSDHACSCFHLHHVGNSITTIVLYYLMDAVVPKCDEYCITLRVNECIIIFHSWLRYSLILLLWSGRWFLCPSCTKVLHPHHLGQLKSR